jgi:hypothetical protein
MKTLLSRKATVRLALYDPQDDDFEPRFYGVFYNGKEGDFETMKQAIEDSNMILAVSESALVVGVFEVEPAFV